MMKLSVILGKLMKTLKNVEKAFILIDLVKCMKAGTKKMSLVEMVD